VHRLAAVLSADAVGYTRLMEQDETETFAALHSHRDAMSGRIREFGGRLVDSVGDGLLAEFSSAIDAVACSVEVQRDLAALDADLAPDRRLPFRIGVNVGDLLVDGDEIAGSGINVAARIQALADPGGVAISGTVFDQVRGRVDLRMDSLGEQKLKNFPRPVRVYRVRDEASAPDMVTPAIATPELDRASIAVLPFANLSGGAEDFLADGMTEELTALLSRVPGFFVIARTTCFQYKSRPVEVRSLRDELGVRYVVEGSLRVAGDRVRITAQLIETQAGTHLWSESYTESLADVFALHEEVASQITAQLLPPLIKAEAERATRLPPASLDAWTLYQAANARYFFRGLAPPPAREILDLLDRAIALDPSYAYAIGLRGNMLAVQVAFGWSDDPAADSRAALADGRRAFKLAPDDPTVLQYWGLTAFHLHDPAIGITTLERCLKLDPNNAHARANLGHFLAREGRGARGEREVRRAMQLSPGDPRMTAWLFLLSITQVAQDEWKRALESVRQSVEHFDESSLVWMVLAATASRCGQHDDARRAISRALELDPTLSLARGGETMRSVVSSEDRRARELVASLEAAGLR
jgi:TolB-like protein/Flp pilus assembly protein TadD